MALLSVDSVPFDLGHEGLYLGTANPPETGKSKMAELGTPALSSLPMQVQIRSLTDLVRCIWLLTLAVFAFSNGNGLWSCWCLLGLEDSAEWCYLCHPYVQGCPGSCKTEKSRGAPVSSSSLFKGRAMQATPSPCQGPSRLGFVREKQLLSALHNHCKPYAFGGI